MAAVLTQQAPTATSCGPSGAAVARLLGALARPARPICTGCQYLMHAAVSPRVQPRYKQPLHAASAMPGQPCTAALLLLQPGVAWHKHRCKPLQAA